MLLLTVYPYINCERVLYLLHISTEWSFVLTELCLSGKSQSEKDFCFRHFRVLFSHLLPTISFPYFSPSFSLFFSLTCLVSSVSCRRIVCICIECVLCICHLRSSGFYIIRSRFSGLCLDYTESIYTSWTQYATLFVDISIQHTFCTFVCSVFCGGV